MYGDAQLSNVPMRPYYLTVVENICILYNFYCYNTASIWVITQPERLMKCLTFISQDMEKNVAGTQQQLEDATVSVQHFISEHAQLLSPAQSRMLLKSLSGAQRAFRELAEKVSAQRCTLELQLEVREDESQQQEVRQEGQEACVVTIGVLRNVVVNCTHIVLISTTQNNIG